MAKLFSLLKAQDSDGVSFFRLSARIPLLATQAANGTLFSFRWADPTLLVAIMEMRMEFQQTSATAAAAILDQRFQAFVARGFTVADSAGTLLTLTGNNNKKKTSMQSTQAAVRISAAIAGLTVGTRVVDANPFLELQTAMIAAAPTATAYAQTRKDLDPAYIADHPILLAQNEGIIVQGPTTVFGTPDTANLLVELSWAELNAAS